MTAVARTVLALALLGTLPAVANAERVVPPGNSAVNQYTETYPTPGGGAVTGAGGEGRSPEEALGARNAERLESRGPLGVAVAATAAATASGSRAGGDRAAGSEAPVDSGRDGGSSGLGEAVETAAGGSGGVPGALVPLAILGAALGSLAFLWRRKRRVA